MNRPTEPYEIGSIVAGKRILKYQEMTRACRKLKPSGNYSHWTVIYFEYEAECLICGSIAIVGSSAFKKRLDKGTVRCKKCAVKIPLGGSPIKEPEVIQIDDILPPPPVLQEPYHAFIHR